MSLKKMLCCGAAALSLSAGSANAATINLIDLGGVAGSPALQGFQVAANYWASMFTNNAVINLGVGFSPLNPGVIAQAGSRRADISVANWQNLVNATKSNSAIDQALVLPGLTGGGISGLTVGVNATGNNDPTVTAMLNGTQTASRVLYANSSVIKAIGGSLSNPNLRDADITFSSTFGFDFNPGDGLTPNTFDFIGVAIHEIGHALGFVSGVDFFDVFSGNGPGAGQLGYDLNDTSIFSALDMFRYSAPGTLDLRTGGTKYFSIDGGQTALFGNTFSTGRYNGDGRQASHWKDAPNCQTGNGIMDPTFCFSQEGFITGLDLAAFDAMGWNLRADALTYGAVSTTSILRNYVGAAIPEPATWAMMIIGFGMVGGAYRRRKTAVSYQTA
jgi:PEP-CTERM motif